MLPSKLEIRSLRIVFCMSTFNQNVTKPIFNVFYSNDQPLKLLHQAKVLYVFSQLKERQGSHPFSDLFFC